MTRVANFGVAPDTILPAELNTIQDDYEVLYKNRFTLLSGSGQNLQTWDTQPRLLGPVTGQFGRFVSLEVVVANPVGSALLYWDPKEWTDLVGDRTLTWRLRSALGFGSTTATPFNTAVNVGLRQMSGAWATGRAGFDPDEAISSSWATTGFTITHAATATVTNTVWTQSEAAASSVADWFAIFAYITTTPPAAARAVLAVDLSLTIT